MPLSVNVVMGAIPATLARERHNLSQRFLRDGMTEATEFMAGRLAMNTPSGGTGKARQAVVPSVETGARTVVGHVDYAEPVSGYIAFVDQGTRPHWPPYAPIALWATRVLGTSDADVVNRIRAGIARKGTKAQKFVEQTAQANERQASMAFDMGVQRSIQRFGGSGR